MTIADKSGYRKKAQRAVWALIVVALIVGSLAAATEPASGVEPEWPQVGATIEGESNEWFGSSLAMSSDGSRVAIGAPYNESGGFAAGRVRVLDWDGAHWVQVGADINGGPHEQSGRSVAMSADGSRLAIGAPSGQPGGELTGAVTVFDWSGVEWVQAGAVIRGEARGDRVGWSVALSADGSRVAVGSRDRGDLAGYVQVFDWNGAGWKQVGPTIPGAASDQSGTAVALSADGSRLAIGSPYGSPVDAGEGFVRVFDWIGSAWVQVGVDIDGVKLAERSGSSVALSADGSRIVIGSLSQFGSGVGRARVFQWSGSSWIQVGVDIDGEANGEDFGWSVAMSADGSSIAVGAIPASSATRTSRVRVFDWTGSLWQQAGSDVVGRAELDMFGSSVAMSADGATIAIGADASRSLEPGSVRVIGTGVTAEMPDPPTCQGKPATHLGTEKSELITGTSGPDVIVGLGGDDFIQGMGGDDLICAGNGDDFVAGGDGRDRMYGGNGVDRIEGGAGVDRIYGQAGNDVLVGDGGSDRIFGGDGADTIRAGSGADRVWGGPGDDELRGMGGQDRMWGEAGNDNMQGNWQSDRLYGGPGNDRIAGAEGKDKLYGEAGDDELFGGSNSDFLDGGPGIDHANGQLGKDSDRPNAVVIPDVVGCIAETKQSC